MLFLYKNLDNSLTYGNFALTTSPHCFLMSAGSLALNPQSDFIPNTPIDWTITYCQTFPRFFGLKRSGSNISFGFMNNGYIMTPTPNSTYLSNLFLGTTVQTSDFKIPCAYNDKLYVSFISQVYKYNLDMCN